MVSEGGRDVVQIVSIAEPARVQLRNGYPFPRTEGSGQAHCVGISKACCLFGLRLRGLYRSCKRSATTEGKRTVYDSLNTAGSVEVLNRQSHADKLSALEKRVHSS